MLVKQSVALLEDIGFIKEVYSLEHAILYRPAKGYWKTMDEEILSYLYNESAGWDLVENRGSCLIRFNRM